MLVSLCEPGQLEKLGPVLESHSIVPWVLCALRRGWGWSLMFKQAGYLSHPQVALSASLMPVREFVLGRPGTCSSTEQRMPGCHVL